MAFKILCNYLVPSIQIENILHLAQTVWEVKCFEDWEETDHSHTH